VAGLRAWGCRDIVSESFFGAADFVNNVLLCCSLLCFVPVLVFALRCWFFFGPGPLAVLLAWQPMDQEVKHSVMQQQRRTIQAKNKFP
jgi:hypothetical protein